jgi:hypothetical protein
MFRIRKMVLPGIALTTLLIASLACSMAEKKSSEKTLPAATTNTLPTEIVKATPTLAATAASDTEPCTMAARLQVGGLGQVVSGGASSAVYSTAGDPATEVGQIAPGKVFDVIGGPQCVKGINWWEVSIYNFIGGWVSEGQGNVYFLESAVNAN